MNDKQIKQLHKLIKTWHDAKTEKTYSKRLKKIAEFINANPSCGCVPCAALFIEASKVVEFDGAKLHKDFMYAIEYTFDMMIESQTDRVSEFFNECINTKEDYEAHVHLMALKEVAKNMKLSDVTNNFQIKFTNPQDDDILSAEEIG